jgi:hypothetical protein
VGTTCTDIHRILTSPFPPYIHTAALQAKSHPAYRYQHIVIRGCPQPHLSNSNQLCNGYTRCVKSAPQNVSGAHAGAASIGLAYNPRLALANHSLVIHLFWGLCVLLAIGWVGYNFAKGNREWERVVWNICCHIERVLVQCRARVACEFCVLLPFPC